MQFPAIPDEPTMSDTPTLEEIAAEDAAWDEVFVRNAARLKEMKARVLAAIGRGGFTRLRLSDFDAPPPHYNPLPRFALRASSAPER